MFFSNISRYYVLELCNASLEKLFLKDDDPKKYSGPMPTANKDVLLQLARGLEHIHKKGLVHRDLKPENVLIWVDPNTQKVLMKWADFGLSKRVNEKGSYSMQSGVKGTLDYSAPEILKLLEKEDKSTSTDGTTSPNTRGNIKSDVFAEGLVFGYFLLGGVHLFGSRYKIRSNIIKKEPPNLPSKSVFAKNMEILNH
jgi:serine/threonine-protein kinase/endoribonuclease IRE1